MELNLFNTIGIGAAFSPNLEANLNEAARLSLYFDSKLILIHVGEASEDKKEKFQTYLKDFINLGLDYSIVFKSGNPVEVILKTIETSQIELLLLGALKQENFLKYHLGSIARKITRQAKCSVLLMTHPSSKSSLCEHIIVNGLDAEETEQTITSAMFIAKKLGSHMVTIVEEISTQKLSIKVDDDASLRKSNIEKEKWRRSEKQRINKILETIPETYKTELKIKSQPIFGKGGYSIGHYAEVVRADLLVMNAPKKRRWWDRLFPHDLEYILTELPSDVLIVR